MIELLFYLLAGHALADYVLQTDIMAKCKNRQAEIYKTVGPNFPGWCYWLSAHALIHGGTVALITGIWWLGLIETVAHWLIDFAKCENKINIHQDQFLHIVCKFVYLLIVFVP